MKRKSRASRVPLTVSDVMLWSVTTEAKWPDVVVTSTAHACRVNKPAASSNKIFRMLLSVSITKIGIKFVKPLDAPHFFATHPYRCRSVWQAVAEYTFFIITLNPTIILQHSIKVDANSTPRHRSWRLRLVAGRVIRRQAPTCFRAKPRHRRLCPRPARCSQGARWWWL